MLCPVMGKTMIIPTGDLEKEFQGMIKLNESSTDIWKWIEAGKELDEIYNLYAETYGIGVDLAKKDVDGIVTQMQQAGVFE